MWKLGKATKATRHIDPSMFGEQLRTTYLAKLKHKMINFPDFPADLADLMISEGRGTLKLNLPSTRVKIFEDVSGEPREWLP